ncbi:MAG: hypothetical protein N2380_10355 [bacterium]|nr:hypothetical protein [bacterium]
MNEEIKEQEAQEGVSLEHAEKIEEKEKYEEIPVKEKRKEYLFSQEDIVRNFVFHELISKPVSMRR